MAPTRQVDTTPTQPKADEPAQPAVEVTEDYKPRFLALMAGTYQGYGSKTLNEASSPCSATVTTSGLSTMDASFDILRPEVQLSISRDSDGYHLLAGNSQDVLEVAGASWKPKGDFQDAMVADSKASAMSGSVCHWDDRVPPGSLEAPVQLAREVVSLLAARHDVFPAGSCLSTAPDGLAKFNDSDWAVEVVSGSRLNIGGQNFDLDIGDKTEAVSLTAQRLQRVLELTVASNAGEAYLLQMTKPYGLHFFHHKAADGRTVQCAKKLGE